MYWTNEQKNYFMEKFYQEENMLRNKFYSSCEFSTETHEFDEAIDKYCYKLDAITGYMECIGIFTAEESMNIYNFYTDIVEKMYFEKIKKFAEEGIQFYE